MNGDLERMRAVGLLASMHRMSTLRFIVFEMKHWDPPLLQITRQDRKSMAADNRNAETMT